MYSSILFIKTWLLFRGFCCFLCIFGSSFCRAERNKGGWPTFDICFYPFKIASAHVPQTSPPPPLHALVPILLVCSCFFDFVCGIFVVIVCVDVCVADFVFVVCFLCVFLFIYFFVWGGGGKEDSQHDPVVLECSCLCTIIGQAHCSRHTL